MGSVLICRVSALQSSPGSSNEDTTAACAPLTRGALHASEASLEVRARAPLDQRRGWNNSLSGEPSNAKRLRSWFSKYRTNAGERLSG
jgi:hypothetical protein